MKKEKKQLKTVSNAVFLKDADGSADYSGCTRAQRRRDPAADAWHCAACRRSPPSLCARVHVFRLSSGLSAIITSCGLITTLPKKSHDLKVTVTWHAHFSSSLPRRGPSPPCSFHCGNHGNNRLEPVCDTRLHFVRGEVAFFFLGFRWWVGGKWRWTHLNRSKLTSG